MSQKKVVLAKKGNKKKGTNKTTAPKAEMLFNKQNYMFMIGGAVLVLAGIVVMSGGEQAADQWNVDEIYSFRRMVIAPIMIVAGLVMEIYAIFKK